MLGVSSSSFFFFEIGSLCGLGWPSSSKFVDHHLEVADLPVCLPGARSKGTVPVLFFQFEVLEGKLSTQLRGGVVINVDKRMKYISSQTPLCV